MKKIKYMLFLFLVIFITGCKKNSYKLEFLDNDTVTLGMYPQTLETRESIINELNNKKAKWIEKEYYVNSKLESIMKYSDIDLDNDGLNDYRGVIYSKYKPNNTNNESSASFSYQDDNGYELNKIYWFKYEKIKWKILKTTEEKNKINYLLESALIIDSTEFLSNDSLNEFSHNGKVGYSNNYELSNIRKWLNNDFLNSAFNKNEKEVIIKTNIDNSGIVIDGESNKYACSDTSDKIYIHSYNELKDFRDESRQRVASDYAKIEGVFTYSNGYSNYMLRTPSVNKENSIYYVDYDGAMHGDGIIFINNTTNTFNGILPLLTISVNK